MIQLLACGSFEMFEKYHLYNFFQGEPRHRPRGAGHAHRRRRGGHCQVDRRTSDRSTDVHRRRSLGTS